MREVWGGTDEEDCVWVDEAADGANVSFVVRPWTGDGMKLDAKVLTSFIESRMGGARDDPRIGLTLSKKNVSERGKSPNASLT